MKDFLLTSTIPYWLVFIMSVGAAAVCVYYIFINRDSEAENPRAHISKGLMYTVSAMMTVAAIAVFAVYKLCGGNLLWWITSDEYGFWAKLLRLIPLLIFLIAQGFSPFLYTTFMEKYLGGKELSIKSQFISVVIMIPVAIIVYIIASAFVDKEQSDMLFWIVSGVSVAVAIVYSLVKNIKSTGSRTGIIFTVTSMILCVGTLLTVLIFIVALISLIFEMLPLIGVIIGISFVFGKNFGNAVMNRNDAGQYIASDGSAHSTQSARDSRNTQIYNRRQQQNN